MLLKQRIIPIFFIFLLLLPVVFSACAPNDPPQTAQTQTGSTSSSSVNSSSVPSSTGNSSKADAYLKELETVDYGGKEFRIAAYRPKNIFPSESEDIIDDIVLERNEKVEQQFHVKLVQAQLSGTDFFESLRVDKSSGIVNCDLVVAPVDMMNLFVTYSMYTNVNTLGLDFSRPYYDKGAMDAATTGIITYAVSGSYTASPENSYCLFYNKTAYRENGLGDVFALVNQGNWTWQTLLDQVNHSVGNNAAVKMNYGIGSSADEAEFIRLMWASSDVPFFKNDPPYHPALEIDTAVGTDVINLIKKVRNSASYYGADEKRQKSALESFAAGELLFYVSEVSDYANLSAAPFSVGIAPLPKYSADQKEYSTYSDNTFQAVYVLDTCPDLAMTAKMIDALNAASYELIDSAYLSLYMHMYLSSNEEGLMLSKIFSNRYFEIGYILGDVYNQFASASTDMIYRVVTAGANFRVTYQQNEKQFRRFLSNAIFDYPEPSSSVPASSAPASTAAQSSAAGNTSAPPTSANAPAVAASTAAKTTVAPPSASKTTAPKITVVITPATTTAAKPAVTTAAPATSAPAAAVSSTAAPVNSSASATAAPSASQAPVTTQSAAPVSSSVAVSSSVSQ